MVVAGGLYPTEGSSDEKDGSFDACNAGAAGCHVDLITRRGRSSATDVCPWTLSKELTSDYIEVA